MSFSMFIYNFTFFSVNIIKIIKIIDIKAIKYIDFAINGESAEKIYSLFDNAFELEHKIEIILALYKQQGFEFKDIYELIENRNVLIFNYYDSSWRNKTRNRPSIGWKLW